MPGRAEVTSPAGTGEISMRCAPNFKWTGLLTVAPVAGSTKNTRGPLDEAIDAGGVLAGVDAAGFAGSEELHAASTTAPARAANPAQEVRTFMVRLLDQQVRVRKETALILVQAMSGMQGSAPEHLRSPQKASSFLHLAAVSAHGMVLAPSQSGGGTP